MKIIEERFNRYGQMDYDWSYINWGFEPAEEQMEAARELMDWFPKGVRDILDVGCGVGRYHQVWLQAGYSVTGLDISETFIQVARAQNADFPEAHYVQADFSQMGFENQFDLALWIDPVELSGRPVSRIFRALRPGGRLIFEMRNENYRDYKNSPRHVANQSWTCKNGVYHLIRHGYNPATCEDEHEEIIFDLPNDTMIRKLGLNAKKVNAHASVQILEAAGFERVRFVDNKGELFDPSNDRIKRYFMVGEKEMK